ncbi:MAG: dihydrofolate synthase/folylpolyglutamate synthase [Planctomycetota bacterium]|jgi:dihydrofolate synthase/folylpolyglutamate synthase
MAKDRLEIALDRLDGLINWEQRDRSAGMDRSLDPIVDVLKRVGAPHQLFSGVLVAGTKGKGSVCALIGAALSGADLSVGIYASPHVERVTERVRIDGAEVSRDGLAGALEQVLGAREAAQAENAPGGKATWFDLMTAAAYFLFAEAEVDWAIVEVGIGGRLDSTRSLEAPVAVVTNVALEHTAVLGDTRVAIAGEKGAVISKGGTLVTGIDPDEDPEVWEVLEALAQSADGRLVSVPQRGDFEQRNRTIAEAVLNEMGRIGAVSGSGERIWRSFLDAAAVASARLPGRAERFVIEGVNVVLDCGHTAESAELLLQELERDPDLGRKPKLIIALGQEKDAPRLLKAFVGHVDRCLCTTAPEGRLHTSNDLAELAFQAGHDPEDWEDPEGALWEVLGDAKGNGGWVLIFGSFYLASVLRASLAREC